MMCSCIVLTPSDGRGRTHRCPALHYTALPCHALHTHCNTHCNTHRLVFLLSCACFLLRSLPVTMVPINGPDGSDLVLFFFLYTRKERGCGWVRLIRVVCRDSACCRVAAHVVCVRGGWGTSTAAKRGRPVKALNAVNDRRHWGSLLSLRGAH